MREELKENIKQVIQKWVPFLLSVLFILVNYVPSYVNVSLVIRPAIGMICVFYWVLHRPDLFNMLMVFFLGCISDFISSAPLGADVIAYLIIYVLVSNLFSFFNNKPFVLVWYGFMFIFIIAEFAKWFLVSVYYAEFLPFGGLFFTILFTIACYPVISLINDAARKFLMNDEG